MPVLCAPQVVGATCLYAVYDPVSGRCTLARAGHPPPVVVTPDGRVDFPELPAGPPLGLGGLPFEAAELELPEGSLLALYTKVATWELSAEPAAAVEGRTLAVAQLNDWGLEEVALRSSRCRRCPDE
ncbi:hypothetical protein Srufu_076140 [Streptomyces libani subsp. rufus]|nr:hypothetical protein Srufu_076140 [Streptomyces libani subsp. rufus]